MIELKSGDSEASKHFIKESTNFLITNKTKYLPDDLEQKMNCFIYGAMVY